MPTDHEVDSVGGEAPSPRDAQSAANGRYSVQTISDLEGTVKAGETAKGPRPTAPAIGSAAETGSVGAADQNRVAL